MERELDLDAVDASWERPRYLCVDCYENYKELKETIRFLKKMLKSNPIFCQYCGTRLSERRSEVSGQWQKVCGKDILHNK